MWSIEKGLSQFDLQNVNDKKKLQQNDSDSIRLLIERRSRHKRVTKDALFGFTATFGLTVSLLIFSVIFPTSFEMSTFISPDLANQTSAARILKAHTDGEYSGHSCDDLMYFKASTADHSQAEKCEYARTCNNGTGIYMPIFYCSEQYSTKTLFTITSPLLISYTILLFRIVGSTAEDYFSPALEYFSYKMRLPSRFAGVTLLALGNGAPDVAASVNAIRQDKSNGYLMAIGEMTGSGMFIGTVIVGLVIVISGSLTCRSSLVRDVVMFFITLCVVLSRFQKGVITSTDVQSFFAIYVIYVFVVLICDVYHIRSTHKENKDDHNKQEISKSEATHNKNEIIPPNEDTKLIANESLGLCQSRQNHSIIPIHQIVDTLSNYAKDGEEEHGWGELQPDGSEPVVVVHPHHGGVLNLPIQPKHFPSSNHQPQNEQSQEILEIDAVTYPTSWVHAITGGIDELGQHFFELWQDIYQNEQCNLLEKILLTAELPIIFLRKITVPVPCDGYYCRPLVALSLIFSPFHLQLYLWQEFDITFKNPSVLVYILICIPILLGLLIFRFGPVGDGPLPLTLAAPISLYGFILGSTWMDFSANKLVQILSLMGILCHIPSPIMGLSVLAVGNCIGDLSANVAVARKGLGDMALTACFAGPVLSYLIGIGIGFSAILNSFKEKEAKVHITPPLVSGFFFSMLNCLLIVICGVGFGGGKLHKEYGYILLVVYIAYGITTLSVGGL